MTGIVLHRRKTAAVAAAIVFVVLLATLVGPRIPGLESLPGLPGGGLDYAAYGGEFAPLDPSFIDRILGRSPTSAVGGRSGPGGVIAPASGEPSARTVVEHPFTNDDFEDAFEVTAVPFTARTYARGAGRQGGEPAGCTATGRTVWYRYRAASSRALLSSTSGSQGITSLAVYRGGRLDDLDLLGCDTDTAGQAVVGFPAARGETYHFQIAQQFPSRIVFSLDPSGATEMISAWPGRGQPPGPSGSPAISTDGRYVAFHSVANHVDGDDNICDAMPSGAATTPYRGCPDIFIKDRRTGRIEMVSRSSGGVQGNDSSLIPDVSRDGRYVSFTSWSDNLVAGDTNRWPDIFVHDRVTGRTEMVSVSSSGRQGTAATPTVDPGQTYGTNFDVAFDHGIYSLNNMSAISEDGRFVAFATRMNGLVPGDTNSDFDVFLHDRRAGETVAASIRPDGSTASGDSIILDLSADGRHVVFDSVSADMTAPDDRARCGYAQRCVDIFLYDHATRRVEKISRTPSGGEPNGHSVYPTVSRDGRFVAYTSDASNIVAGDVGGTEDAFVHDRRTGKTIRVSVSSDERPQVGETEPLTVAIPSGDPELPRPMLSDDGSRVVFYSRAPNLVPGDENNAYDVFVRDILAGTTIRVSVSTSGREGNDDSYNPVISGDGRTVAFTSQASNLVARDGPRCADTNPSASCLDVFTHEMRLPP